MSSRRRLAISIGVLLVIYCIGVLGYLVLAPGTTLLQAVYMTTITLSTVGYRETVVLTPAVQAWTIALIVGGALTVAILVASVAGILVESDIGRLLGRRNMDAQIKQLRNHTIVCGFGRMGRLLVDRLIERKIAYVIVERDPDRLRELEQMGWPHIAGDATEEWVLAASGIERAHSLVAVLANDADNLFVTLTARQMHPELHLIARAENPSSHAKLLRAGANRVISPQHIGAEWIANVLTRPHVADFVDMAARGSELEMAQVEVPARSVLAGKSLRESELRKHSDVMVVAIRRPDGSTRFNPGADEIIESGDLLITIGKPGAAAEISQLR